MNLRLPILCLIAGGILPLAFAPFYYYWIAVLSVTILFAIWFKASPTQAAWNGFLFGIGMFGAGTSWVYISIHRFGGTPIPLAIVFTSLFVMTLALFPAIQGYFVAKFMRNNKLSKLLIFFPVSWVICEWIRSWLFTGFPWLLLGYSQTNSPLRGYAAIFGVYGITFLIALSSSLITAIIIYLKSKKIRFSCLITLFLIWIIGWALTTINWTDPSSKAIKVSLIQGNIPQQLKWQPNQLLPTMDLYYKLTTKHLNSDIIIWPEAAIPLPLNTAQPYIQQLAQITKQHHVTLILGIPATANMEKYYNSAIAIGDGNGIYYKRRLVPFGEYVPFENYLRGMFAFFDLPMSEFISGAYTQQLLNAKDIKIAPFICYEVAYTNLVRQALPQAQLLLTISNDAWFGDSLAAEQHLQIAQMRCLETGRYMLFSTNNGVTAIITPQGKISYIIPKFKTLVLTGKVYAMKKTTPYIKIGSGSIIAACILLLLICLSFNFKIKTKP